MAQMLQDLTLDEVSLVDRPANSEVVNGKKIPRAVVAIWKRDGADDEDPVSKSTEKTKARGEEKKMTMEDIEKKLTEQEGVLATLTAENKILKTENEIVIKMTRGQREVYAKMGPEVRKAYLEADEAKREEMLKAETLDADARKRYDAAGPAERAEILKAAKPNPFADDEEEEEEEEDEEMTEKKKKMAGGPGTEKCKCQKSEAAPELVRKNAELTDRVSKAESELATIRKRERRISFAKRAEEELPHTSGTADEKGERLMKVADAFGEDSQEFKDVLKTMKDADRVLAMQFSEVGKAGGSIPAERAWDAKVEAISKRDGVSISKATETALRESPEMYYDIEREKRQFAAAR